jgi:hypothetical protein
MWRNILCQAAFQVFYPTYVVFVSSYVYKVVLLLTLLFRGASFFNVPVGDSCATYQMAYKSDDFASGILVCVYFVGLKIFVIREFQLEPCNWSFR